MAWLALVLLSTVVVVLLWPMLRPSWVCRDEQDLIEGSSLAALGRVHERITQ